MKIFEKSVRLTVLQRDYVRVSETAAVFSLVSIRNKSFDIFACEVYKMHNHVSVNGLDLMAPIKPFQKGKCKCNFVDIIFRSRFETS